jgi:4-hydroxy-3-polyprenylbenzoate decarboxylase
MFDSSKIQPHLAFTDLREWMAEADKLGELKIVRGASWQERDRPRDGCRGASDDGPAVIFDDVPGCPKGFRVIINTFAGKRRAMTFGFPQG